MRNTQQTMGAGAWGLLIVLSLLWGGSFFSSKVALAELRPFTVVFARVGIAALVLHGVVWVSGQRMPATLTTWGRFALMGLMNNLLPFSLIFWGQTHIASGLAAILNATTPLWTVLLAHSLTHDERLTTNRVVGVVCGFGGVVLMIGPDALNGLGSNVVAQLAVLGAALSYALAGLYGKQFAGTPPLITATGQVSCTAVMMVPLALVADRLWLLPAPTLTTWVALIALALLSTALAYLIYFRLLATVGVTNLLLVTFLIPVSALLLGMAFLGERLDMRQVGGMLLIGGGLAALDGRLFMWIRATTQRMVLSRRHADGDGLDAPDKI